MRSLPTILPEVPPWFGSGPARLDSDFARLLTQHLATLLEETAREVLLVVPDLMGPTLARRGTLNEARTDEQIRRFLAQITDPGLSPAERCQIYRAAGQDAYWRGVGLDSLHNAFRLGTQVAWRRFARFGREAEATPDQLHLLTETLFTCIEEICTTTLAGYHELSDSGDTVLREKRKKLLDALLSEPHAGKAQIVTELARDAQWRRPRTVACIALVEDWCSAEKLSPSLDPDVLLDLRSSPAIILLPDPDGPGRLDMLRRGLDGTRFSLGTPVPLIEAHTSVHIARLGASLLRSGFLSKAPYIKSADHLPLLLLFSDEIIANAIVGRRMADFSGMKESQRERLTETLLAWLTVGSSSPYIADFLSVHPQTVRYRMRKIEQMFGNRLREPTWRLEMLLALHAEPLTSRPAVQTRECAAEGMTHRG